MDKRIEDAIERNTRRIYNDKRNHDGYYSEADVREGLQLIAQDTLNHDGTVDDAVNNVEEATFIDPGDALMYL